MVFILYNMFFFSIAQTKTALMYDAVNFFAAALHGLVAKQTMGPARIKCDDIKPWIHGYSLINYMRVVSFIRGTFYNFFRLIYLPS